jgi:hypothetical protein
MYSLLARSLLSGSAVTIATAGVLAALAYVEGHHPVRTTNATSHWFHGAAAGRSRAFDLRHTATGFATHFAASAFWAAIFQALRHLTPARPAAVDALGVSALAAVVDYAIVPKRLTPGWEKVVTPWSIALTYGVMMAALMKTSPRDGDAP